jgi:hypothetical protein
MLEPHRLGAPLYLQIVVGMLMKFINLGWRHRLFVLQDGVLRYYKVPPAAHAAACPLPCPWRWLCPVRVQRLQQGRRGRTRCLYALTCVLALLSAHTGVRPRCCQRASAAGCAAPAGRAVPHRRRGWGGGRRRALLQLACRGEALLLFPPSGWLCCHRRGSSKIPHAG